MISDENIIEEMKQKSGQVFLHSSSKSKFELWSEEDGGGQETINQQLKSDAQLNLHDTLFWGYLLSENYGGLETSYIFIFSEILGCMRQQYESK